MHFARCAFVAVLLSFCNLGLFHLSKCSGQSIEDVTSLNLHFRSKKETDIARYWIGQGMQELKQLRAGNDRGLPFAEEKIVGIENALLPLTTFQAMQDGLSGDAWREFEKKGAHLKSDIEVAKAIFDALGAEHATSIVLSQLVTNLKIYQEASAGVEGLPDPTFLSNELIGRALELSAEQKKQIDAEIEQARKEDRIHLDELFSRLEALQNERWNRLLSCLGQSQQKAAKEIIYEPWAWYRVKNGSLLKRPLRLSVEVAKFRSKDGRKAFQLKPEEVEKFGFVVIDRLVYEMMSSDFVLQELVLTDTQTESLRKSIDEIWSKSAIVLPDLSSAPGYQTELTEDRLELLLSRDIAFPDPIEELLTPIQIQWLSSAELQIRLGRKHQSTVTLLHPKMIKKLELSNSTQNSLAVVAEEFDAKAELLIAPFKAKRDQVERKLKNELGSILSEKQLDLYFKYVGIDLQPSA